MKANLTFELPKEANKFKLAIRGPDYYNVLKSLTEDFLRHKVHRGGHEFKTARRALIAVRNEIWRLIEEHNCPIDDV